jgi:hypothetical protein
MNSYTVEELVALVHDFHPMNLYVDEPGYKQSKEFQRQQAARQASLAESQAWDDFRARLETAAQGCRIENWTLPLHDTCRRYRVYLPGSVPGAHDMKAVVALISILAPVYALYASHQTVEHQRVVSTRLHYPPLPDEFRPLEALLEELIQSSSGYTRLPNDVLFTPVPDIQVGNKHPAEVRLIDCLFTDDRW